MEERFNGITTDGITTDRNDPGLDKIESSGMQQKYLVLSQEERDKGFIRPVRTKYIHDRSGTTKCGAETIMGLAIAETYARNPYFYGTTYCVKCQNHFPVGENGEFIWSNTNVKVGT